MAGERRINLGTDATDARYVLEDDGPDGDLVVKDTDNADREVFRYDGTADEFKLRDATADTIDTGEINTVIHPEPGTDLAQYDSSDTAVVLRPNAQYELSAPLTADRRFYLGSKHIQQNGYDVAGDSRNPTFADILYTGDTSSDSRVIDHGDISRPVVDVLIENVQIDGGGAEFGHFARFFTNQSELRNVWIKNVGTGFDIADKTFYGQWTFCVARGDITNHGWYLHEVDGANTNVRIYGPQALLTNSGSGNGLLIEDKTRAAIFNPVMEATGQEAIKIAGSSTEVSLFHPYIESFGADMTTPVGLEISSPAAVYGGSFTGQGAGSKTVHIAADTTGEFHRGRFIGDSDYHIHCESSRFPIYTPQSYNSGDVTTFSTQGKLVEPFPNSPGQTSASILERDGTRIYSPTDLTSYSGNVATGQIMYNDGTVGTEGFAQYTSGNNWVSLVDGSTIA
jgi:hypothetical protein